MLIDRIHECIRRDVWVSRVDHLLDDINHASSIEISCVSNMSKNHIIFPDIIYNRNGDD